MAPLEIVAGRTGADFLAQSRGLAFSSLLAAAELTNSTRDCQLSDVEPTRLAEPRDH